MQTVQSLLLSGKGRNGKSLVVVKAFEHGIKLPGTSGNFMSVADSPELSLLSDASIRVRFSLADITPTNNYLIIDKWTSNTSGYTLYISTSGTPHLAWVASGPTARDVTATAGWPFAVDEVGWLWATLDANDGAGNRVIKFYTSPERDPGPADWDLLSETTTAGTTSIIDGSEALEIGNTTGIGVSRIYRVSISSNITDHEAGLVFEKDFTREPVGGIRNPAVVEDSVNRARIVLGGTAWEWETNPALPVDEYALAPFEVAESDVFTARPAYWYDEASSEWVPSLTVPPPPLPDLVTYVQHALSTNDAVTLPGTATFGNLLLAGYSRLSGTGPSTPAGWTALDNEIFGSAVGVWWYFKWSDGTETAVDFNLTGSTPGSWIVEVNGAGGDPVAADWSSATGSAVTVLSTGEPSVVAADGGYSIAYRRTAGSPGGAEVVDNDYTELDVTGQHHLAEKSYVGVDAVAAEFSWTTARNAVAVTIYVPPA